MSRTPKQLPLELDPDEHGLELIALAEQRHALNVLITEYDWLRAQELAKLRGGVTVSDIIRDALDRELSEVAESRHLRGEATRRLEYELSLRARRAAIDGLDDEEGPHIHSISGRRRKSASTRRGG